MAEQSNRLSIPFFKPKQGFYSSFWNGRNISCNCHGNNSVTLSSKSKESEKWMESPQADATVLLQSMLKKGQFLA
jgi:hypothetical protein